ncbi:MAG: ABC transporter permease, partial [Clostridiales bacterium]|nr:ABC transporter permease [Candidatus Coliplasma equi]
VFVLRLYTVSDDGFRKFSRISESEDNKNSLPEIWMTAFFADSNGIVPGDTVELMMPDGYKDFFVSAIVSSPESMMCSRDSYSWCDFGDFGFVYLDREEADKLFGTEGLSNVNYYKLDSDVSDERKDEIFKEISSAFGGSLVASEKFETSEAKKTMDDDELTQMSKVIRYLPAVVFAMGLFFSFLFISQVIRNQRKTIGLLRGIGYSGKRVLLIFATYCVGVCLSGMIAGSGLGALLTKYCVSIYQKRYSLPYIHYDIKVWGFALMMLGIVAVSLFSCVLQSNTISSVNPAEAYGGSSPAATSELPNWIKKLKLESLTKMTVISIYRNKKRFFMSVFSIAACLVLTLNCIALNTSNNAAMPAAFGGRFCYDLLVKHQDGIFASSLEEIPGVSDAETITVFEDTLYFGDSSLEAQIQAIPENSKLIRPKDASGKSLSAGDGIILEEISAKLLGARVGDTVMIKDVPLKV